MLPINVGGIYALKIPGFTDDEMEIQKYKLPIQVMESIRNGFRIQGQVCLILVTSGLVRPIQERLSDYGLYFQ